MPKDTSSKKSSLGRGLNSLIDQNFDNSILLNSKERVHLIPIDKLSPNPNQPRKDFDSNSLEQLSESIKQYGIIQPIIVESADKSGVYKIIAGERRYRAAQLAKLRSVPSVIRDHKEHEKLEIALIENVQRENLNPIEEAASIQNLHEQFSLPYSEIAKKLGKASSTINNTVRLLNLPEKAKVALLKNSISEGHARAILAIKNDSKRQDYLLDSIIKYAWSVRQAERFVTSIKSGYKKNEIARKRTLNESPATVSLSKKLSTQVSIRRTAKGGKLEISFRDDDDLKRIINLFD